MRFTDMAYSIPTLPLLIVLSSFTKAAVPMMVAIIGFLSWMPTARVVRGSVLSIKEKEFVEAARMIGAPDFCDYWQAYFTQCGRADHRWSNPGCWGMRLSWNLL